MSVSNYFLVPQLSLNILIDQDFKQLCKMERRIEREWIKQERCLCIKNMRKDCILNCSHIKQEINEKTKEIRKRIKNKCSVSLYRSLNKFQLS